MSLNKEKLIPKILYYVAAIALPNIFLFNIYNQNRAEILFNHVLILAVIFAMTSIIMGGMARLLTRTQEGSYLSLLFTWISFWFFESLFGFFRTRSPINSRVVFCIVILFILICLVALFRILSVNFSKGSVVFNIIAGVTILLFVFNALPAVISVLAVSPSSEAGYDRQIRRYFEVDATLPNPDIYWLHLDGMISLDDAEHYFDVQSDEIREKLLELGFVINESAEFVAGRTVQGIAALMSPNLYDSYLHNIFKDGGSLLKGDRDALHFQAFANDGISFANEIAPYLEQFHAFLQIGYTTTKIARLYPDIYVPINQFYNLGSDYPFVIIEQALERHFLVESLDLIELLVMKTPVPGRVVDLVSGERDIEWQAVPNHAHEVDRLTSSTLNLDHERHLYKALIDHLENSQSNIPILTFITLQFTHASNWRWQIGEKESDQSRIDLYPLAHEYALCVMFNMIDMIFERNPDAVIVLQADHGMHSRYSQQALLETGIPEEEVRRLFDSTISAVRIPEQYGGLNAPLDPLNITRELVNRFVGENYQLLD